MLLIFKKLHNFSTNTGLEIQEGCMSSVFCVMSLINCILKPNYRATFLIVKDSLPDNYKI